MRQLPPTLTKYELGVVEWWRAQLGTERLAMIRQPAFKRCRDLLKEMDVTVATVNRRMSLISAVVTLALDNGWVTVNTARITAISEKSSQRVRLLTDTEQFALMKACNASEEPCLADFMITAMGTGARSGELKSLTSDVVALDRGVAILHQTKNKDKRVISIRGKVLEAFKKRKKLWAEAKLAGDLDHNHGFWNRTGPAPLQYNKDWPPAAKASEVEDFTFHDLRHVAACHLAMAGVLLREIAEILGHRQLQMVMRYSHLCDEHVADLGKQLWGDK